MFYLQENTALLHRCQSTRNAK